MKIKALLTAVFLAVAVAPALYATPAAAQAQQTETLEQRLARLIAAGDTAGLLALIRANGTDQAALTTIANTLMAVPASNTNRALFASLALGTGKLTGETRSAAIVLMTGQPQALALYSSARNQILAAQRQQLPFAAAPTQLEARIEPPKIANSGA